MTLEEARSQLATANHILAREGVLDAFGHVSMRHPSNPARYLLARSRSPELIEPPDIVEFTLASQPVAPPNATAEISSQISGVQASTSQAVERVKSIAAIILKG
jgi:ribulose-5-phosphate 4-epimerase/fuculose-1-phosphate aldolase